MTRLLVISPYPSSAPSHRVRLEQYVPSLRARGVEVTVRSLLDERAFRSRGVRLATAVMIGAARRIAEAVTAGRFDAVLVHREALPLPTAAIERVLGHTARRLIFDFDDAIYLPQPEMRTPLAGLLRSPAKFGAMIGSADRVLAGNARLAEHASIYNRDVRIVPTTIDTDRTTPGPVRDDGRVVIGWMGSPSTSRYLEAILPAVGAVLSRDPNLELRLVGARPGIALGERMTSRPWVLERELEDLRGFDIGIMPLSDDEWSRGKCGYKALQYMSAGVATISSPVGVATDLADDGSTGLLASNHEEWVDALRLLASDPVRRRSLGVAGRELVVARYSLRAWADRFHDAVLG